MDDTAAVAHKVQHAQADAGRATQEVRVRRVLRGVDHDLGTRDGEDRRVDPRGQLGVALDLTGVLGEEPRKREERDVPMAKDVGLEAEHLVDVDVLPAAERLLPTACQNGHSLNDCPHPQSSSAAGPACHR